MAIAAGLPSCGKSDAPGFAPSDDASTPEPSDGGSTVDAPFSLFDDVGPISFGDATFVSGSACKPGDYVGTFNCQYQYLSPNAEAGDESNFLSLDVTGPMTITLTQEQSANGENLLTVSGGDVSGTTLGGSIAFTAKMTGQLNCSTGQFVGEFVNGMWNGNGGLGMNIFTGTFTVSFHAAYDNKNFAFVNGQTGGGCIGSPTDTPPEGWGAKYCGPAGSCGPG
jgi:hypothetical protein